MVALTSTPIEELVDRARQAHAAGGPMMLRSGEVAHFLAAVVLLSDAATIAAGLRPTVDLTALDPSKPYLFAQVYNFGARLSVAQAEFMAPLVMESVAAQIASAIEPAPPVQPPCDVES